MRAALEGWKSGLRLRAVPQPLCRHSCTLAPRRRCIARLFAPLPSSLPLLFTPQIEAFYGFVQEWKRNEQAEADLLAAIRQQASGLWDPAAAQRLSYS